MYNVYQCVYCTHRNVNILSYPQKCALNIFFVIPYTVQCHSPTLHVLALLFSYISFLSAIPNIIKYYRVIILLLLHPSL
jgi:hypothetical protein